MAVLPFLLVAVMLAAPSFLAETSPPLTVATDVSELDQVTDLSAAVAGYTDASSEKLWPTRSVMFDSLSATRVTSPGSTSPTSYL